MEARGVERAVEMEEVVGAPPPCLPLLPLLSALGYNTTGLNMTVCRWPLYLHVWAAWSCSSFLQEQPGNQEGGGGRPHDLHRHHAPRVLRRHRLPHGHLHEEGTGGKMQ